MKMQLIMIFNVRRQNISYLRKELSTNGLAPAISGGH